MKYKFIIIIYLLSICSCSKVGNSEKSAEINAAYFANTPIEVEVGKDINVSMKVSYAGDSGWKVYDFSDDMISLSISDESIAIIEGRNTIKGLRAGVAAISARYGEAKSAQATVYVKDNNILYDPTKKLSTENILVNQITPTAWIQGFDFNSKGEIYVLGSKTPWLYVTKYSSEGVKLGEMKLAYFGHGTSCAVEETEDGDYLWLPSFGSQDSGGDYKGERMISRVKFTSGATYSTEDEAIRQNSWYIGDYTSLCPSIDFENGTMAIRYSSDKEAGYSGWQHFVKVYNLKDVKEASMSNVTLRQITRGGETGSPIPIKETVLLNVIAHDLRNVKTLSSFRYDAETSYGRSAYTGEIRALQGFCIGKGKLFFLAGYGPYRDASYTSYDFNGKILTSLQYFHCVYGDDNLANLTALKLTDSTYEPEGIQIRNGRMYVGFGGKLGNKSYISILKMPDK